MGKGSELLGAQTEHLTEIMDDMRIALLDAFQQHAPVLVFPLELFHHIQVVERIAQLAIGDHQLSFDDEHLHVRRPRRFLGVGECGRRDLFLEQIRQHSQGMKAELVEAGDMGLCHGVILLGLGKGTIDEHKVS